MKVTRLKQAHLWAMNTSTTTEGMAIDDPVLDHPGYTGWIDGEPVVCAGVIIQWPGLGVAWATIGEKALKCPGLFKAVKLGLLKIAITYRLHRVETVINAESDRVLQFMTFAYHLGFVHESTMPQYGPGGETYYRMVWFPPYQFSER